MSTCIQTDERFDLIYVDPSSLSTSSRCPAKYMFERLMGLHPRGSRQIAPDYGTCMHAGLPHCYDIETVEIGISIFNELWDEMGYGEDDERRNKTRASETLWHFSTVRATAACPYKIIHFDDIKLPEHASAISENEIPFLIDIGASLLFAGRVDLGIEWNGHKWPCDYKTASEISQRLYDSFWNCTQALGYTLAFAHLTGERPPGLMIEAIRTSKKNDQVALYPVYVKDHLLEAFVEKVIVRADELRDYNDTGCWPQNLSACSPYAGYGCPGFTCQFQPLCDAPDWRSILSVYERREPWHPFDMKEKEQPDVQELLEEPKDGEAPAPSSGVSSEEEASSSPAKEEGLS
jgi:hypothetical protein